jgi:hypothetical protein
MTVVGTICANRKGLPPTFRNPAGRPVGDYQVRWDKNRIVSRFQFSCCVFVIVWRIWGIFDQWIRDGEKVGIRILDEQFWAFFLLLMIFDAVPMEKSRIGIKKSRINNHSICYLFSPFYFSWKRDTITITATSASTARLLKKSLAKSTMLLWYQAWPPSKAWRRTHESRQ